MAFLENWPGNFFGVRFNGFLRFGLKGKGNRNRFFDKYPTWYIAFPVTISTNNRFSVLRNMRWVTYPNIV